jgi:ubiquinone/menaquinone biosynthesis C-methylase UbiE
MPESHKLFSDGAAYERMMGRWSRVIGRSFLDWLNLPAGLRCLDVGCGNGAFTEELIARCAPATVMALDPSEDQIAYARQRPGTKSAEFRVGDAQALPFDDDSYEAATMALVIAFLSDPAKAVTEMARVVRPGGLIAIYMWDIRGGGVPIHPLYDALKSIGMTPGTQPNPEASRREVMQELWQKAGLQSVEMCVLRVPVVFSNFDDFWESTTVPVGPQGKVIAAMSPNAREQLRARTREQLPIAADGRIAYEAFANAAKGRVPA